MARKSKPAPVFDVDAVVQRLAACERDLLAIHETIARRDHQARLDSLTEDADLWAAFQVLREPTADRPASVAMLIEAMQAAVSAEKGPTLAAFKSGINHLRWQLRDGPPFPWRTRLRELHPEEQARRAQAMAEFEESERQWTAYWNWLDTPKHKRQPATMLPPHLARKASQGASPASPPATAPHTPAPHLPA